MERKNQVASLPQSIRLKELGVFGNSLFYFCNTEDDIDNFFLSEGHFFLANEEYPAFTVAELGVMLPKEFRFKASDCYLNYLSVGKDFYCQIRTISDNREMLSTYSENECIARAAMLIHLLENNIITAQEVNERLKQS